jgi:hypothetical protein
MFATVAVLAALAAWPAPSVAAARWTPGPRTTWQIQFSGRLNPSIDATAFDVDMFDTAASTVAALHATGLNLDAWRRVCP